jgi:hypothetical protein
MRYKKAPQRFLPLAGLFSPGFGRFKIIATYLHILWLYLVEKDGKVIIS